MPPQNLYRFESDPCILVNLATPDTQTLLDRQRALQQKIAKLTADLMVITEAISGGENV